MEKEEILQRLAQIERDYDVRVLFAAETGSRAWGFSSPDSDWDIRFVYVHPLDWYLKVEPGRDVIEVMTDDGFDASGWDIKKALGLFRKTNLTFIEWIKSPIVYIDNLKLKKRLFSLLRKNFNVTGGMYHYYHIAEAQNIRYLERKGVELKRYLYYLRALLACKWIMCRRTPPPVPFRELVDEMVTPCNLREEIYHILELKSRSKEHDSEKISGLLEGCGRNLQIITSSWLSDSKVKPPRRDYDMILDKLLADIIHGHYMPESNFMLT
ncbi:nucleotidyltransferase domain-containing protein [Hoylesella nanceiensis]|uniref:nucleotidyltransferase domain-containing protein n=1 Tax=Hoylesella nanceiensis TaxID=425941 RepID=UPI001C5D14CB|nr:nucleotidyltransferase domain-containing protein [Hoylesella nanceiensis]MBW4767736.1 nucleotidyltransferase domain-containing protein [Hoylesella nanceiensis]